MPTITSLVTVMSSLGWKVCLSCPRLDNKRDRSQPSALFPPLQEPPKLAGRMAVPDVVVAFVAASKEHANVWERCRKKRNKTKHAPVLQRWQRARLSYYRGAELIAQASAPLVLFCCFKLHVLKTSVSLVLFAVEVVGRSNNVVFFWCLGCGLDSESGCSIGCL